MSGLQVINTYNDVIIDPTYRNYCIIQKGTVANSGQLPGLTSSQVLLVRPSGGIGRVYGSSVGFGYSVTTGSGIKSSTGYVDYVILQNVPPASASTHGLVVYRPDGTIAFDSYYSGASPAATVKASYLKSGDTQNLTVNVQSTLLSGRSRYVNATSLYTHYAGYNPSATALYWFASYALFNSESNITAGIYYQTDEAYSGGSLSTTYFGVYIETTFYIMDA